MNAFLRRLVVLLCAAQFLCGCAAQPPLTAAEQQDYYAQAESTLRAAAGNLPDDFWAWLQRLPDIRAGLLLSGDPVNPVFARNLDVLRRAFAPDIADKYAHLLLAMALTAEAVDAPANPPAASIEPEVAQVADYLRQHNLSVVDAVKNSAEVLSQAAVSPSATDPKIDPKKIPNFWDKVARFTQTYPARGAKLNLLEFTRILVAHQEEALPKGVRWPLFPLAEAPYPLLALLRGGSLPVDEIEFFWQRVKSGVPRVAPYGRYSWDYTKPEFQYKKSAWNPGSMPRILEDGGVCGRLSTMGEFVNRALGVPTLGVGQPGHRAYMAYGYNAAKRIASVGLAQSIAGPERTTVRWLLPEPWRGLSGTLIPHYALASSMNIGLARYQQSLLAFYLARREQDTERQRQGLARALTINPYNVHAWLALTALTPAAQRPQLLADMQAALTSGVSAPAAELADPQLEPNADFSGKSTQAHLPPPPQNAPNYGRYLAAQMLLKAQAVK